MLSRLATFVVGRRKLVLLLTLVGFFAAGALGGGVAERLSSGGFQDPDAEASRAGALVREEFGSADPNLILVVTAKNGSVDDPATAAAGAALTDELAKTAGVEQSVSYWTLQNAPPLKSEGGNRALVLARLGGSDNEVNERAKELTAEFTRSTDVIDVQVGGFAAVFGEVNTTIQEDLAKAEGIAVPITMLLLIVVFGSVIAAGLPVAVGILSIVGTFLVLFVISLFTEVSIFSLNLTTAMGLGLAIDYSLFVVSRFREELRGGKTVEAAVVRTTETAGRTVLFSALTVAASLAALFVFPISFLRSFAYAGIAVVGVAALGSVVVLPAALAALGPKIDRWALFKRHPKDVGEGFWHRLAIAVMRRPVVFAVGATAFLVVLGLPFLGAQFGQPDDRVLPPNATTRAAHDILREEFASNEAAALAVVATDVGDPAARSAEIAAYATELSKLPGVARVDAVTGFYVDGNGVPPMALNARFANATGTFLNVVPSVEPMSPEGEQLVADIRSTDAPFEVVVGGMSAELVDGKQALLARLPLAIGIIGAITFTLLFLMFGSVLVPVKAVVLNLLSLSATFGAMVWIFQDGHLAGFLNFTPTGTLDISTPILMFCVAFGLSMDYEVFLLSRIKEEYDRTGDNVQAVAVGLERTGRIVTAAAALLAVVFIAMATSGVTFIKLFGVGLTMAVLMDATLVRATLVPAFMRLAGDANWWAPKPMRRFYDRWGISEGETPEQLVPAPAPEAA